jgi:nucleotide-binding universal stress UspA family protein
VYRKIIVGHDLHDGGDDALVLGRQLAEGSEAKLVVAGVFPFGMLPHGFEWREEEQKIAAEIERLAEAAGAEPEAIPSSSPARGLHDLAEETGADLIVVGSSRHSSAHQVLAGNVGLGLLHGSPCAVAIAPRGYRQRAGDTIRTIAVGFDGSEESSVALRDALELARETQANLKILAVAELPPIVYGKGGRAREGWAELREAIEQQLRMQLDEAVASIPDDVMTEASLVSGDPAVTLADAGGAPGTILVLGSRAYGPARRVLLGSVSAALVKAAPCPLLVHPRGVKVEARTAQSAGAESAA